MADYFASIFGTEKDKVNCSFYFKIGACRHGDRCSRVHNKPTFSQTILLQNLYVNPKNKAKNQGDGREITDEEDQRHFDEFFEDIYVELSDKYGPIKEMNVCDNLGDHLIGNVYVKFKYEEDAEKAVEGLNGRWFDGKPVYAELSTVTDFREAGCRQYELDACTRGGFCNFMHLKQISKKLKRRLFSSRSSHSSAYHSHRSHRSRSRSRSGSVSSAKSSLSRGRSRSPYRSRSRSTSPPRSRRAPKSSGSSRNNHSSSGHSRRHRRSSPSKSRPADPSPPHRSRSPHSRSRSKSPVVKQEQMSAVYGSRSPSPLPALPPTRLIPEDATDMVPLPPKSPPRSRSQSPSSKVASSPSRRSSSHHKSSRRHRH